VLYEWDFDTAPGTFNQDAVGVTTTHAYPGFGVYTVTLRVTDDNAPPRTATASVTVHVDQGNRPPVADAGGPYSVVVFQSIQLDGTASADPDAACGDTIQAYAWDLDRDGEFDDAAGAEPELTWQQVLSLDLQVAEPGTETPANPVRLRVTDSFGEHRESETTLVLYETAQSWIFTLGLTGTTESRLTVGMTQGASDGFDPDYDERMTDRNTGTGILTPDGSMLRRSVHAPADHAEWILSIAPIAQADSVLSWDTGDVPAAGLYLLESDETGRPAMDGARVELAASAAHVIPAGTVRHYRLCHGLVETALALERGWNLASVPIEPFRTAVETVFQVSQPDRDTGALAGGFWSPDQGAGSSGGHALLRDLHARTGVWVYADSRVQVTAHGVHVVAGRLDLAPGWNLVTVGKPTTLPVDRPGLLYPIWAWNAGRQAYDRLAAGTELQPGAAYWVYALDTVSIDLER
jgi:hypothetical protein